MSLIIKHRVTLDLSRMGLQVTVPFVKRDAGVHSVSFTIMNDGEIVKLEPGVRAFIEIHNNFNETGVVDSCAMNHLNDAIIYTPTPEALAVEGNIECSLHLIDKTGAFLGTPKFIFYVHETGSAVTLTEIDAALRANPSWSLILEAATNAEIAWDSAMAAAGAETAAKEALGDARAAAADAQTYANIAMDAAEINGNYIGTSLDIYNGFTAEGEPNYKYFFRLCRKYLGGDEKLLSEAVLELPFGSFITAKQLAEALEGLEPPKIEIDSELSEESVNPVQNAVIVAALKVLQESIDSINECGCVVDSALSETSVNPVQNAVIAAALSEFVKKNTPTDDYAIVVEKASTGGEYIQILNPKGSKENSSKLVFEADMDYKFTTYGSGIQIQLVSTGNKRLSNLILRFGGSSKSRLDIGATESHNLIEAADKPCRNQKRFKLRMECSSHGFISVDINGVRVTPDDEMQESISYNALGYVQIYFASDSQVNARFYNGFKCGYVDDNTDEYDIIVPPSDVSYEIKNSENKIIYETFDNKKDFVTVDYLRRVLNESVDSELSEESKKPVQNAVVNKALEELRGEIAEGGMTEEQELLLNKLSGWYDEQHYVKMTGSLSMSPSTTTYEMGASVSVTFSWTFSKLPIAVTFNGETQTAAKSGSKTVTVTSETHTTLSYTLYGKYKEGETVTQPKSISFRNRYYYGYAAEPDTIDGNFIKSLSNKNWANGKTISFTSNCTAGQYVWYAYPKRFGAAEMWMGGFQGGFEEPSIISLINGSDVTEDYYLYRSTNAGINLSIQAK